MTGSQFPRSVSARDCAPNANNSETYGAPSFTRLGQSGIAADWFFHRFLGRQFRPSIGVLLVSRWMIIVFLVVASAFSGAAPASAQTLEIQGLEVTPFIGGRFGGTFDVQPEGAAEARASLGDSVSYGVSAGIRFDDFSLIEFRWTRANSVLRLDTGVSVNPLATPIADVTLNQFHGDFTREFPLDEVNAIRPFIMASVGATHLGTSSNGFTRFSFGLGTGLKVSVNSKVGIRVEARWLPIWVQPEVSAFACGFGGCVAVLSGRLTQQFEVTAGPVFRF